MLTIISCNELSITLSNLWSYNWDSVRSAVISFAWSTILKSAEPLVAFVRAIVEVIGRYVPTTVLRSRSGDEQWFDACYRRAYDAKQTTYHAWCRAGNAEHWGQFVLARAEAKRVYGAARESHNEPTRNTLKHSTYSHSGGIHRMALSFEWNLLFLLSGG